MSTSLLHRALAELGLSQVEQNLYILLTKLNKFSITAISKELAVERVTVYRLLDRLVTHGLVHASTTGKRKIYTPESPGKVVALLKKKQSAAKSLTDQLSQLLPELQFEFNQAHSRQKIKIYEQEEDYINLLHDFVAEANGFIYWIGSVDILRMLPLSSEEAIQFRINSKITSKWISFPNREFALRPHADERREVRWLPSDNPTEATIIAFGNKIAIWNTVFLKIIVLEDQLIFNLFRTIFDCLWIHLSEKPINVPNQS